eukprot:TRINITY_DN2740_c1_g1_i4.p1 TRINITY_DN2740_c1_g1~~TRINITY_DN2740_c1_g1_i4.p1  ORF type:complete len:101 (-),score=3.09 TRINITY_DN2740_c1_g1_i4:459-761(-)
MPKEREKKSDMADKHIIVFLKTSNAVSISWTTFYCIVNCGTTCHSTSKVLGSKENDNNVHLFHFCFRNNMDLLPAQRLFQTYYTYHTTVPPFIWPHFRTS